MKKTKKPKPESLYRTQWLMAYNALHDIVHRRMSAKKRWQLFRKEIVTAPKVASRPG